MNYQIRILSTAYSDIAEIIPVLNQVSANWASRFVDELERRFELLETMPKLYVTYTDMPDFRKINIEGFLVFYTVDDTQQTVEIHRIINGKMDISKIL